MNSEPIHAPSHGHFAEVNGIQMYYEIHGEGSPLILLHGTPGTGKHWATYFDALGEHYRLIVPDFRGYGRSTNPQRDFSHRQLGLDVCALMDQLEIGEFKAMGISSGALTLLHMATQQRDRILSMVLVGSAPYIPAQSRTLVREWIRDSANWDWTALRQEHVYGDEQIHAFIDSLHDYIDHTHDVNFTPPYLATITAQTLVVHGDRDPHFPVTLAVEMYQAIPNAYLWIVPNGDHVPILGERADAFTQTALAFLNGNWQ